MRNDQNLKDAASSTEGITQSSVNYLPKRKSKYLNDLLINQLKHFCWQFLLFLRPCLIVFLFCLHLCILSLFEIISCIVKSLIVTSTFAEIQLKKGNLKGVFLGAKAWVPKLVLSVSQITWLKYSMLKYAALKFFGDNILE